jgi:hypothetical protein
MKLIDETWLARCIDHTEKEIVALKNMDDSFAATHIAHGRLKAYLWVQKNLKDLPDEEEQKIISHEKI